MVLLRRRPSIKFYRRFSICKSKPVSQAIDEGFHAFLSSACYNQSVDRLLLVLGRFWIMVGGIKPVALMHFPEKAGAEGERAEDYPMILVQIPMCNEREVYQQSIGAVCVLDWSKERMLVQVLDDSSELDVQLLIKAEVQKWQQRGVRILYRHRLIRTGYKSGNLKAAIKCDYVKDYEFVAIFDADFQPPANFLKETVPHFKVFKPSEGLRCSSRTHLSIYLRCFGTSIICSYSEIVHVIDETGYFLEDEALAADCIKILRHTVITNIH